MKEKAIKRLAKAIGYPDRVSDDALSFTFRADGVEIAAEETDGRLVFSCALSDDENILPTLATYAAGRMLKEEAALSYGLHPLTHPPTHPPSHKAFLWQDVSAGADAHELLRFFETFMDSCDWWRARVDALRGSGISETSEPATVMIRP